jgi:hypothetical protein
MHMTRSLLLASLVAAALAPAAAARAQSTSPLAGVWTLNRSISEVPPEIGFNVNWIAPPSRGGQNPGSGGGGRGRRGSGGGGGDGAPGAFATSRESYDDARRVQLVTADARNPPVRLMIVDTPAAVTITNELGQSRTLHPTGREESAEIQGVSFVVTTRRDADRLVVVYAVERNREVRYTYSRSANPAQLIVEVQFLERGAGDKARLVYEPARETQTAAPAPPPAPGAPGAKPSDATEHRAEAFDERPGAELKGLKSVGILVEELSTRAVACGLNREPIEAALSKRLVAGGLAVRRNSDEDTYLYVNIMTTGLPDGTCVSRYDAFLYTHGTATLSYRDRPVLVQVSLMHRGGLGNSAPSGHAAAVTRGLENFVDLFVTQIHDANK